MKKRLQPTWRWLITACLSLGLWGTFSVLHAQIWTYSYPNNIVNSNESVVKRSDIYDVKVKQGNTTKTCYVMYDRNQQTNTGNGNVKRNPDNHWTNFSKSGAVTIEITRIDGGNLNSATIYPRKKGYTASVSNNKATISIPQNVDKLQLWVEINGLTDEPLFIFVDPQETDVPNINGSNVTVIRTTDGINTVINKLNDNKAYAYFEPGIHKWGNQTGSNYSGYQMPIKSGKKIYLPGGAYVIGSFNANSGANGWKVYGRGVISGAGLDILPTAAFIPWSAVHAGSFSGARATIEGIVSMCPPHFALTVRGPVDIDNAKMISWWQSTDGTITGDNSTVDNCFFKVMDDAIKVYGNNCTHDNNTVFHQVNGAVLQFSWGGQHGDGNLVTNTYVINSIYKGLGATSNTAVVNVVNHNNGEITQNNTIRNVYIDNGCHRLLGMDSPTGTYRNFTIENVELNQGNNSNPQAANSYLSGNANFSNFDIINLKINGNTITGTNANSDQPNNGKWWFSGKTSALTISSSGGGGGPSNGTFFIEHRSSGNRLKANNSGGAVGTTSASSSGNQVRWEVVPTNGGWFFLVHKASGKKLFSQNGTSVTTGAASKTGNKVQWKLVNAGGGWNRIQNRASGRWLHVQANGTTNFTLGPTTWTGNNTQWKLTPVSSNRLDPASPQLAVYPNPTQDKLLVEGLPEAQPITIINLMGKQVLQTETQSQLDVSTLSPGIYFLKTAGFQPVRFIKQ